MRQANLYFYAPGDGTLVAKHRNGPEPLMWEARKAFKRSPHTSHLREREGFRLVRYMNSPTLIPNVKRIGANLLQWGQNKYSYVLRADTPMETTHDATRNAIFSKIWEDGEIVQVKHIATVLALAFFLSHEDTVYLPNV